nr:hypothetical protein [Tanacetum cinerariifolium]
MIEKTNRILAEIRSDKDSDDPEANSCQNLYNVVFCLGIVSGHWIYLMFGRLWGRKGPAREEAGKTSQDAAFVITGENIGPKPNPVPNYLRKPSVSDHHKQMENLDVDDLEERLEEARRVRSILLSMYGFTPADF